MMSFKPLMDIPLSRQGQSLKLLTLTPRISEDILNLLIALNRLSSHMNPKQSDLEKHVNESTKSLKQRMDSLMLNADNSKVDSLSALSKSMPIKQAQSSRTNVAQEVIMT